MLPRAKPPQPQERHSRNFSVPSSLLPDDTKIKVFMGQFLRLVTNYGARRGGRLS